jgi:hypothetical protein
MKRSRGLWIGGIAFLISLAVFPWIVANLNSPLLPSVFEETATIYFVTESAYLTREAALELSATSEMMILPSDDDEPMPGDPDYTPPSTSTPMSSSGASETLLVQLRVTPSTFTGISSRPLERYSCPSPAAHISGQFPPNHVFSILGWNVDLDNVTYLLIEDEPSQPQVWLRIPDLTSIEMSSNYLETPAITCRTYIAQITQSPEQITATMTVTMESITATATIPLPRIASATPPPPVLARLEITEQDAIQQVMESVPELRDPVIEISPDGLEIQGYINLPGPLGTTIRGDVVINAELVQEDTKLRVAIQSVTVAGRNITNTEDGQQVENTINNWLNILLVRRDLQSFELLDGLLIIDVLERQFSEFPQSAEQNDEPTNEMVATPSSTTVLTLVVSTVTPSQPTTPLPMWTQTASPTGSTTPEPGGKNNV